VTAGTMQTGGSSVHGLETGLTQASGVDLNATDEDEQDVDKVETAWHMAGMRPKIRNILEEAPGEIPRENEKEKRRQLDRARHSSKVKPTTYERTMKREIDDFNDIMRDRLRAIGVEDVDEEQFPETLEPGQAVVGALLKYHNHCQGLGKFYAFGGEGDDDDEAGDEVEKHKKLTSLINGLQDDPPEAEKKKRRDRRAFGSDSRMDQDTSEAARQSSRSRG